MIVLVSLMLLDALKWLLIAIYSPGRKVCLFFYRKKKHGYNIYVLSKIYAKIGFILIALF